MSEKINDIDDVADSDSSYVDQNSTIEEGSKSIFGSLSPQQVIIRLILLLAVVMLLLAFFWPNESKNKKKSGDVSVAKGVSGIDTLTKPGEETDELQLEEVIQKYTNKELIEAGHKKATVAPTVGLESKKPEKNNTIELLASTNNLGILDAAKSEQVESPKRPTSFKKGGKKEKDVNPYVGKIEKLYSRWDKGASDSEGVNLLVPAELTEQPDQLIVAQSDEDIQQARSREVLKNLGVEYLRVLPATLDLGYNSDTGGLMVLTIHHPGLEGVKFLADTSVGAYNERAVISLSKGVLTDGTVINVEGVVVDQNDRIPSIKGKVDRHLLYNSVYGLGTALLDSFAAYKELDSGLVNSVSLFPPIASNQQTVDTDGLIVANGADALSRSIKQSGSFRPNTVTTKPFISVGVIFLP